MDGSTLAGYIDLSILRPDVTGSVLEETLKEARRRPFASVTVPPCYVGLASKVLKGSAVRVGAVCGFPVGYHTKEAKLFEAREAVRLGAGEIDMVMNVSAFKSGRVSYVEDEIREIKEATGVVLKVIIEAFYLTDEEKVASVEAVVRSGADFVKTSTGFAPGGATVEDVRLLSRAARGRIGVKAAGGIKTLGDALRMIEAGATRVGTSAGLAILEELKGGLK